MPTRPCSGPSDEAQDLRDPQVVTSALDGAGLDGAKIVAEATAAWVVEKAQAQHDEAVTRWDVFGVPTFIIDERAVFVRLMNRPHGEVKVAEPTIGRVLELLEGFGDLNEYKFTKIPR